MIVNGQRTIFFVVVVMIISTQTKQVVGRHTVQRREQWTSVSAIVDDRRQFLLRPDYMQITFLEVRVFN